MVKTADSFFDVFVEDGIKRGFKYYIRMRLRRGNGKVSIGSNGKSDPLRLNNCKRGYIPLWNEPWKDIVEKFNRKIKDGRLDDVGAFKEWEVSLAGRRADLDHVGVFN